MAAPAPIRPMVIRAMIAASAFVVTAVVTLGLSAVRYAPPALEGGQLVVSFKHAGNIVETQVSARNDENLLPHMRSTQSSERVRMPVRMGIWIDNDLVKMREYAPSGLFGDGNSIAVEVLPVEPGDHVVSVRISDDGDDSTWNYVDEKTVSFEAARRRVVIFDRDSEFKWYDE